MSEYTITTCDICAPNGLKPATEFFGTPPDKRYVVAPADYALAKLNWEEQEVGHVCPACVAEQKDRAKRDAEEEAVSQQGVAITLEEGLARLDAEEAKLFTPEAEAKIRATIEERSIDTTYNQWAVLTRSAYEQKRASLRKSFGQG